jgi:hypothetical protein
VEEVPSPGIYSKQLILDLLMLAKRQQSSQLLWSVWDAWAEADKGKFAATYEVQNALLQALCGKHEEAVTNGHRFTEVIQRLAPNGKVPKPFVTTLVRELAAMMGRKRNITDKEEATSGWTGPESPTEVSDYFVVLAQATDHIKNANHPLQRLRIALLSYAATTLSPTETCNVVRIVDRSYGAPLVVTERQVLLQQLLARFTKVDILEGMTEGLTAEATGWTAWSSDLIALEVAVRDTPAEDLVSVSSPTDPEPSVVEFGMTFDGSSTTTLEDTMTDRRPGDERL